MFNLICDLTRDKHKPTIRTNSLGCFQVAKDPARHWRLKHIDTRYYFSRDVVQIEKLQMQYTPSQENPADVSTKPLVRQVITRNRSVMCLVKL